MSTDVMGYRSDGGGLGQDQGLSDQLRRILTSKLPLLNSPGTVLENSLYYDTYSSSVTAVEEQAYFAKDRIVLSNLTLGASPSCYIPSVLFTGSVFWVAQLNKHAHWGTGFATNYFYAPHGWGFHAIRNVILYMGSSNIAQIQISGKTNYMIAMACCETESKRQLVLEGAGRFLMPGSPNSPMAPKANALLWRTPVYGDYYNTVPTSPDTDITHELNMSYCCVPIRLPWSSMCVLDKRLSMDTKLLTTPIQITLETRPPQEIFDIRGDANNFIPQFTLLSESTVQTWQEELSDKSLSVRNELLAMPEFNIGLPFQYAQSVPFQVPNGTNTGLTKDRFLMNISSIINSDLTTFLFMVTSSARDSPGVDDTNKKNGWFSPLVGEQLEDLELLLNGQQFFRFKSAIYPYVSMAKHITTTQPQIKQQFSTGAGSLGTAVNFEQKTNIYELNNSRIRSIISEAHMQNTARFTNQTFQLEFSVNRSLWYPGGSQSVKAGHTFTVHMCYLYNGVFLIGGDGGTTKLITN